MTTVSETTRVRSPKIGRTFELPDGDALLANLMPVGVDFVHLTSELLFPVPPALRRKCSPKFTTKGNVQFCRGTVNLDGFNFSLTGPIGQRDPSVMHLSISFNPNTLDHFDPETQEVKVYGDNTLAYNPSLLSHALRRVGQHLRSLGVSQDILDFALTGVDFARDLIILHPDSTERGLDASLPPSMKTVADTMVESILELLSWQSPPYMRKRKDYGNKKPRFNEDDELEGFARLNNSQVWSLYDKTSERQQKQAETPEDQAGTVDFMSHSGHQLRLEWKLRNKAKVKALEIPTARQLNQLLAANSNPKPLDEIFDGKLRHDFLRLCDAYSAQLPKLDARWVATLEGLSWAQSSAFDLMTQESPRNLSSAQRKQHKENKQAAVDVIIAWLDEQGSEAIFESIRAVYLPHQQADDYRKTKTHLIRLLSGAPVPHKMHLLWQPDTSRGRALESLETLLLWTP